MYSTIVSLHNSFDIIKVAETNVNLLHSSCMYHFAQNHIISVPESTRNETGTDEKFTFLLAVGERTSTELPNFLRKDKTHNPSGTRIQRLSHSVNTAI